MEVSDCMPALISSAPHLIPCGHLAVWLKAVSRERVAATLCASLLRCWQIQCWFLSPRFWCSRCVTLAHTLHSFTLRMLMQIISGRGPPHFHMHVTKEHGLMVQKFLAELLYSDMTLFSSVIASLGYSALNLNETQTAVTRQFPYRKRLHDSGGYGVVASSMFSWHFSPWPLDLEGRPRLFVRRCNMHVWEFAFVILQHVSTANDHIILAPARHLILRSFRQP